MKPRSLNELSSINLIYLRWKLYPVANLKDPSNEKKKSVEI